MATKKNNSKNYPKISKIEEINWKKLDEMDREKTVIFIPISPLEEHGPHLPIGTDFLIISHAVEDSIKILNEKRKEYNFLLYPSIPLGSCMSNTDFPGTINSNSKTIRNIIYDIGSSLGNHGFKNIVICTYHMALEHLRGINLAMNKLRKKYDMNICEPWGPYFYNNEVEKREPKLGFDTTKEVHAGFRETSLMKYQYPYLVDESYKELQSIYRDLRSPRVLGKKFKDLGLKDGYVGSPARADADYGRWFYSETVNTIVDETEKLIDGKKNRDLPSNIKSIMKSLFWR